LQFYVKYLVIGYVGVITGLIGVLHEQKQILSLHPTPSRWFNHFLTVKTLGSIEIGNISQGYLDSMNMEDVKKEAKLKNLDLNSLTIGKSLNGVVGFIYASKNFSIPASQRFVQYIHSIDKKV
jgi:xanthosine utilization system XapX-like protein